MKLLVLLYYFFLLAWHEVDCEIIMQCQGTSKLKSSIVKNPTVLTTDPCIYTITPYNANVCQLLVEFILFELQQPTLNPTTSALECSDNLQIGDFKLCGHNTGQHLYFPFNVANGATSMTLAFNLPNRLSTNRWHLVITQLECPVARRSRTLVRTFMSIVNGNNLPNLNGDLDLLAPIGCTQYFTHLSGNIKSFNYKADGSSYYLPNMNYAICVKPSAGATKIKYQSLKFSMSNELLNSAGFDSDCHSTIQTTARREDYLMIPNSYVASSPSITPTYYCGTALQMYPNLIASAPFILYFSSDDFTDASETGFDIQYNFM